MQRLRSEELPFPLHRPDPTGPEPQLSWPHTVRADPHPGAGGKPRYDETQEMYTGKRHKEKIKDKKDSYCPIRASLHSSACLEVAVVNAQLWSYNQGQHVQTLLSSANERLE